MTAEDLEDWNDHPPPIRMKSRRTRIKEHRPKRDRKRFYEVIGGGEERARSSKVRRNKPKRKLRTTQTEKPKRNHYGCLI